MSVSIAGFRMNADFDNDVALRTALHEYARLLAQLHALMAQGKDESAEADSIREQMERPWQQMTKQEQEWMRGLSADLYASE